MLHLQVLTDPRFLRSPILLSVKPTMMFADTGNKMSFYYQIIIHIQDFLISSRLIRSYELLATGSVTLIGGDACFSH